MDKKQDCSRGSEHSPSTDTTRVEKLEASMLYAEDEIEQLSAVLAAQDKRIERLERLLEVMVSRLKQSGDAGIEAFDAQVDRPPHY